MNGSAFAGAFFRSLRADGMPHEKFHPAKQLGGIFAIMVSVFRRLLDGGHVILAVSRGFFAFAERRLLLRGGAILSPRVEDPVGRIFEHPALDLIYHCADVEEHEVRLSAESVALEPRLGEHLAKIFGTVVKAREALNLPVTEFPVEVAGCLAGEGENM